jgi:hypothetical protein
MSIKKVLTIVVPSYNRNPQIKRLLCSLYDQLSAFKSKVSLVIIDNSSKCPYKEDLDSDIRYLSFRSEGVIKLITNSFNIGMSGNILRCFESVDSEWMLMLSDDDLLKPGLIKNILDEIETAKDRSDVSIIKFRSNYLPLSDCKGYITDMNSYIDYLSKSSDHFNSFLFLSNSLYRVKSFSRFIQMGYLYAKTYAPHLIIQLFAIYNEKVHVKLSDKIIVEYQVPEIGYNYGLVAGLGVGCFKEFDFNLSDKSYKKLMGCFYPHSDFKVIVDLFYYTLSQSRSRFTRLAKQYIYLVWPYRGFMKLLLLKALVIMGRFPSLFKLSLLLVCRFNKDIFSHISEMKARYHQGG